MIPSLCEKMVYDFALGKQALLLHLFSFTPRLLLEKIGILEFRL
jgi:hypothetical protein